ncbi:Uncharacterised protein [Vibrio cholerae]|nr:Uncharacterised protein [Vibrio cholerae]
MTKICSAPCWMCVFKPNCKLFYPRVEIHLVGFTMPSKLNTKNCYA